jgi:SAM-dependent methyltransferase
LLGLRVAARVPAYFDVLIDGFRRGTVGRSVHLGHWDEAPREPTRPGEFERAQARLDEILLGASEVRDGQCIVDVGCGFGASLQKVDAGHRRMRLLGVNIDARQLAICRELVPRGDNALRWVLADACELPLADSCADRVLCVEAMFHFAARRAFFLEAGRVLRPGGALVLSDIFVAPAAADPTAPRARVEAALRGGYGPWPEVWCEPTLHDELARAAGLRRVWSQDATRPTCPSHRFTVPRGVDDDGGDPGLRAALTLKRLHERGALTVAYMRFDKTGA